jgi:hypothetical protein
MAGAAASAPPAGGGACGELSPPSPMRSCCSPTRPGIRSTRFICCPSWCCSGPAARGLTYALVLSGFVLLEHPVYFNLIGPNYPPTAQQSTRSRPHAAAVGDRHAAHAGAHVAIAVDLGWMLLRPAARRRAPVLVALATIPALLWFTPDFLETYRAGRLATTPLRPAIVYLNALDAGLPIVASSLTVGREAAPAAHCARPADPGGRQTGSRRAAAHAARQQAALCLRAHARRLPRPWSLTWTPAARVRSAKMSATCSSGAATSPADARRGCLATPSSWPPPACPTRLNDPLYLTLFWRTIGAACRRLHGLRPRRR